MSLPPPTPDPADGPGEARPPNDAVPVFSGDVLDASPTHLRHADQSPGERFGPTSSDPNFFGASVADPPPRLPLTLAQRARLLLAWLIARVGLVLATGIFVLISLLAIPIALLFAALILLIVGIALARRALTSLFANPRAPRSPPSAGPHSGDSGFSPETPPPSDRPLLPR